MVNDVVSNKRKEKISAFLDDDMHRDELMSFSLSGEADDAEIARRYQMVGDALRGEMSDSSFVDISQAVREALVDEAQYSIDTALNGSGSNAQSQNAKKPSTKNSSGFNLSGWFKPLSGMAVAASVAVVMVVTLSEQGVDGVSPAPVATNSTQPADNSVQVASEGGLKLKVAQLQNAAPISQQVDPRLFNRHLEFATQDALQGRMPLVRAVSYEADK